MRRHRSRPEESGSITSTQFGRFVRLPLSFAKDTTHMPADRHSPTSSQMPVHRVGG